MKLVDATNLKLGRLASKAAKEALNGEQVTIVNAEKAVVTGRRKDILSKYQKKRKVGSRYKGPFFPKAPHLIMRRTIRGMLPYKKETGRKAFGRIKAYLGVPQKLAGKGATSYDDAKLGVVERRGYMTLAALSKELGWKKIEG